MRKKYYTGIWRLTFKDGTTTSLIAIKNNAQATFIAENTTNLNIKMWQARDEQGDFYPLK